MKIAILIISIVLLLAGCSPKTGHWIAFPDKEGKGYYHIYDDLRSEKFGSCRFEKLRDWTVRKESSNKTNQWTVDYYKIEGRKKYNVEISGVTLPSFMRFFD